MLWLSRRVRSLFKARISRLTSVLTPRILGLNHLSCKGLGTATLTSMRVVLEHDLKNQSQSSRSELCHDSTSTRAINYLATKVVKVKPSLQIKRKSSIYHIGICHQQIDKQSESNEFLSKRSSHFRFETISSFCRRCKAYHNKRMMFATSITRLKSFDCYQLMVN